MPESSRPEIPGLNPSHPAVQNASPEISELKSILAVYEAGKAVFSSTRMEKLLPVIVRLSLELLKADDVSVMLLGEDGKLVIEASAGLEDDRRKQSRLALGESVAGKAAKWKEPLLLHGDAGKDDRFPGHVAMRDIKSAIVHPVMIEGEVLGVLNINRTRESSPFTESDLRCATIFSSQVAQAVCNARLYGRLEGKIHELEEAREKMAEMQSQLVQAEKLAAIGQLASGVAHELNNPLSGIIGLAQVMLEGDGLTGQQKEDLETIHAQSQRCRYIIQNLLAFSRRNKSDREPVDVGVLLNATLRLVQYDFTTSGIKMLVDIKEAMTPVSGNASQLEQVFLNLITNARQSMEDSGGGTLKVNAHQSGGMILVSVSDTGPGIAPDIISRIFDPFFTTKPVGKGTGLGLSISHGIVEQHGGGLSVKSEPGQGATFTVELPCI
jgi:signal transduction histidine kinase